MNRHLRGKKRCIELASTHGMLVFEKVVRALNAPIFYPLNLDNSDLASLLSYALAEVK